MATVLVNSLGVWFLIFGHYAGSKFWKAPFGDYNVREGRSCILVLMTTLFAAVLAGRIKKTG